MTITSETPKSPRATHRSSRSGWGRLVLALVAVSIVSGGTLWFVAWYQQERPLLEVAAVLNKGDASGAMKLINQFLRAYPDDARAQSLKARILVEAGQHTEGLRLFHRFGAAETADLHAWAKAHLMREEWSDALPVLERLLQLNPNDPDALHEITACRSFLGQYREAFESAKRLSVQPGNEARAWLQMGTLHKNLGNAHSAIESWERVLEYDPQTENLQIPAADFLREFGRQLLQDGKAERARDVLKRSLELKESAETLASLGEAQQQLGDEAGAVSTWKRAVEIGRALREPRESLAQVAYRAGRFEEARTWLQPVLNSPKPTSSATYLMLRICQSLDDRDAARHWQERTDQLRKNEKRQASINHALIEAPESFWARAIRAYRFAEAGNWHQAEAATRTLLSESVDEPFVIQLVECVRKRGPLPSLDLIPLRKF